MPIKLILHKKDKTFLKLQPSNRVATLPRNLEKPGI